MKNAECRYVINNRTENWKTSIDKQSINAIKGAKGGGGKAFFMCFFHFKSDESTQCKEADTFYRIKKAFPIVV